MFGINTPADAVNRLAVKSDAVLLSHDDVTPGSGDIRMTVNKAGESNMASLLFQSGWSGRAEIGLAGTDGLSVKTSPDGATWATPMQIGSGAVSIHTILNVDGPLNAEGRARFDSAFGVGRESSAEGGIFFNRDPDNPFLLFSAGPAETPQYIGQFRANYGARIIGITGSTGSPYILACTTDTRRVGIMTTAPSNTLSVEGIAAPETDNAYSCGTAAKRWSTVYAATGTINTSDMRDKDIECEVGEMSVRTVDEVPVVFYRWRAGASVKETDAADMSIRPGRRTHAGWRAQDVRRALDREELDCAVWGLDDPHRAESRQWLRPDQMTAILWEALRVTRRRLDELAGRVDALERNAAAG